MPLMLEAELGWSHERSSSRAGESMLRALSVPSILCALGTWLERWVCDFVCFSLSLVGVLGLRPGKGKENLEARPMALGGFRASLKALVFCRVPVERPAREVTCQPSCTTGRLVKYAAVTETSKPRVCGEWMQEQSQLFAGVDRKGYSMEGWLRLGWQEAMSGGATDAFGSRVQSTKVEGK
jgi:hypothetical protein